MGLSSFPRSAPEELGIASKDVISFINDLEKSGSEMHGLMMLRHSKVFAEGWWAPYASGVGHAAQSLTKTMTGSAYGAAELLGILDFDELVIDVFPEYARLTSGPFWDELRVYNLLTMSSGMIQQKPVKSDDWMQGFFTMPIVHKPGTAFYYNSSACSLVGACIRKRSGMSLLGFLSEYVFSKIGIDSERIKWLTHPDGQENGSGGIISTTEDNARIIQLYLQQGKWNDTQVISSRWADMAVQVQNPHVIKNNTEYSILGYGGMMWVRQNCFYADGGMGQYAVGYPEHDLTISINETISSSQGALNVQKALFSFDRHVSCEENLPHGEDLICLRDRLSRLSIPSPQYSRSSGKLPDEHILKISSGEVPLFADDFKIFADKYQERVHAFMFLDDSRIVKLRVYSESGINELTTSTDGRRWYNSIRSNSLASELSLSAYWQDEITLVFEFRWIESCRLRTVVFRFDNLGADIVTTLAKVGGFDEDPWNARADYG